MIIDWIKILFRIVRNYDKNNALVSSQLHSTARQIDCVERIMRERTEIHADISHHRNGISTVVVCGQYKNNDFVQIFQVTEKDFSFLVDQLRYMSNYAKIKTVDVPIELKSYIKKDN